MIGVNASNTYDHRWKNLKIGQSIMYRKTYYGSMQNNTTGIIKEITPFIGSIYINGDWIQQRQILELV